MMLRLSGRTVLRMVLRLFRHSSSGLSEACVVRCGFKFITLNDLRVTTASTMLAFERNRSLYCEDLEKKLDRKISYRIEIPTDEVQIDDVVVTGYYQALETRSPSRLTLSGNDNYLT